MLAREMDLENLNQLTERLRTEAIGDPIWIPEKHVYEYKEQTVEVAVVLKITRAAHGINAMHRLCLSGLFIDLGVIYRCVSDCLAEVHFLLEEYPERSSTVEKFLKYFFSMTIDGHLKSAEQHVQSKEIHNAMVRSLTGKPQDEPVKKMISHIYQTFSGYVHAGYAHIMQMYGGAPDFNIGGIPSIKQRTMQMQLVVEGQKSVIYSIAHASRKFGLKELYHEAKKWC